MASFFLIRLPRRSTSTACSRTAAATVPVALAGVLLHGAQDVLGVLLRLVLVEQRDHLPHHHLRRVVAQLLRDRHQPDAVLGELAHVELEAEGIAEEAREGVHDDDVEGVLAVAGALDHALELGALVVGRRGAGLDVLGHHGPAAAAREFHGRSACSGIVGLSRRISVVADTLVEVVARLKYMPACRDGRNRGKTDWRLAPSRRRP